MTTHAALAKNVLYISIICHRISVDKLFHACISVHEIVILKADDTTLYMKSGIRL